MPSNDNVVTRFAPSPTGDLHIGGVRTALFAYLYARKMGGEFILRIEDTDKKRENEGSIAQIMDTLAWIGISWDAGPDNPGRHGSCLQSDRLAIYKRYAQKLIDKGLAYPDPYSTEEIQAFREAAQANKQPFLYRHHRPENPGEWDGTQPLRFKVTDVKRSSWHDEVRGDLEAGEEMLDDIIIIKADGFPTYNFAHIVDDHEMGVTHVMRGEEFISSTPKFLAIYDALEIPYPKFVTLPPIMGADGKKKLSKRDGAKGALDYAADGYLPASLMNFLALIGWNPGTEQEVFTEAELTQAFTIEKVQKSGGAFNEDKLRWLNKEHLAALGDEDFFAYTKTALPEAITTLPDYSDERLAKLAPSIKERVHNAIEIKEAAAAGEYSWAFSEPTYERSILKWKKDDSETQALPRLEQAAALLADADFSTPESIKAAIWDYAEEVGRGELLWPLRVSLTGLERSPDPFTCAYIVGKEATLTRLTHAISLLT